MILDIALYVSVFLLAFALVGKRFVVVSPDMGEGNDSTARRD